MKYMEIVTASITLAPVLFAHLYYLLTCVLLNLQLLKALRPQA